MWLLNNFVTYSWDAARYRRAACACVCVDTFFGCLCVCVHFYSVVAATLLEKKGIAHIWAVSMHSTRQDLIIFMRSCLNHAMRVEQNSSCTWMAHTHTHTIELHSEFRFIAERNFVGLSRLSSFDFYLVTLSVSTPLCTLTKFQRLHAHAFRCYVRRVTCSHTDIDSTPPTSTSAQWTTAARIIILPRLLLPFCFSSSFVFIDATFCVCDNASNGDADYFFLCSRRGRAWFTFCVGKKWVHTDTHTHIAICHCHWVRWWSVSLAEKERKLL